MSKINPFRKGDIVRCVVDHYSEYNRGDVATVYGTNGHLIMLANVQSPVCFTEYHSSNFVLYKRNYQMPAYEKTKYFASEIEDTEKLMFIIDSRTPLRDHQSETISDVKSIIRKDQRYMILKTVALIEYEEPKPPIKITEYR